MNVTKKCAHTREREGLRWATTQEHRVRLKDRDALRLFVISPCQLFLVESSVSFWRNGDERFQPKRERYAQEKPWKHTLSLPFFDSFFYLSLSDGWNRTFTSTFKVDESIKHVVADNNNIWNRERRKKKAIGLSRFEARPALSSSFSFNSWQPSTIENAGKIPRKNHVGNSFISFFFILPICCWNVRRVNWVLVCTPVNPKCGAQLREHTSRCNVHMYEGYDTSLNRVAMPFRPVPSHSSIGSIFFPLRVRMSCVNERMACATSEGDDR